MGLRIGWREGIAYNAAKFLWAPRLRMLCVGRLRIQW